MNSRFPYRSFALSLLLGVCVLNQFGSEVEARPKYKAAFDATYPDVTKKDKKVTCNLCHYGDDKKKRNHYGDALAKELKKPNVLDEKAIKDALKAIESGDCKTGKWKDRLEKGEWPCLCGENKHPTDSYIARQLHRVEHLQSESVP